MHILPSIVYHHYDNHYFEYLEENITDIDEETWSSYYKVIFIYGAYDIDDKSKARRNFFVELKDLYVRP